MQCPIAFSPCSPRATWPWPDWVCGAFEKGDVLYYTIGPHAKPYINIREQKKNLLGYFRHVWMNGGIVNKYDGEERCGKHDGNMEGDKLEGEKLEGATLSAKTEMEGTESVKMDEKTERRGHKKQDREKSEEENQRRARALDRFCAKAKAQSKKRAQADKRGTQSGDEMTGREKKRLEHAEAMKPAAKKVRVEWDAQQRESREEGMGEWEVLDWALDEEEWVDVSNERTAGDRCAMVRWTVLSGGEGESDGA